MRLFSNEILAFLIVATNLFSLGCKISSDSQIQGGFNAALDATKLDSDDDGTNDAFDCAPGDGSKWQELTYTYIDADLDTNTVSASGMLCVGMSLPPGYLNLSNGADCDDADPQVFQTLSYTHRDVDLDTHPISSSGSLCAGAALPAGYLNLLSSSSLVEDCNDNDPQTHTPLTGFADADQDGFGAGASSPFCTNGTLPATHVANNTDCDDATSTKFQLLNYSHRDVDLDSYTVEAAGQICAGQTLPPGYATAAKDNDCNDEDAKAFQLLAYTHRDVDLDSYTVEAAGQICTGQTLPAGYTTAAKDNDCNDQNAEVFQLLPYGAIDKDQDGFINSQEGYECSGAKLPAILLASSQGKPDCNDQDPELNRVCDENSPCKRFTSDDKAPYESGSGTQADPYLICSEAQFTSLTKHPEHWTANFKLAADISLHEQPSQPIGTYTKPFSGTFVGEYHTIHDLQVHQGPDLTPLGLFGVTYKAFISSLILNRAKISGAVPVGGIIGKATSTTLIEVLVKDARLWGRGGTGGLIGLTSSTSDGKKIIPGYIRKSAVIKTLIEDRDISGGLTGLLSLGFHIHDSLTFQTSLLQSRFNVGGLAGSSETGSSIVNSYSRSMIQPAEPVQSLGGLAGSYRNPYQTPLQSLDSYWDTDSIGLPLNPVAIPGDGQGLSQLEFTDPQHFSKWNMDIIWMQRPLRAPVLRWIKTQLPLLALEIENNGVPTCPTPPPTPPVAPAEELNQPADLPPSSDSGSSYCLPESVDSAD